MVELLVVIAIIAVLAGLILTGLIAARRQAAINEVQTLLMSIDTSLESYADDFGDFPPSNDEGEDGDVGLEGAEELYQCLRTERKNGPYLSGKERTCDYDGDGRPELADAWGHSIRYLHHRDYKEGEPNPRTFRLMSDGPDGEPDPFGAHSDDVVNWNKTEYADQE